MRKLIILSLLFATIFQSKAQTNLYENPDFDEIAKMLDMNNTAVRVTLSRARKTIREKLTNTHSYGIK